MRIPGMVDLQVNGYAGVSFSSTSHTLEDFKNAIRVVFSKSGCVAILVTVITSSWQVYEKNLPMLASICQSDEFRGRVLGIHLEGPFISSKTGALGCHPKDCVLLPTLKRFRRLQQLCDGNLRMITMAAESPGAPEICREAVASNVCVSLGHQLASESDIERMVRHLSLSVSVCACQQSIDNKTDTSWS